MPRILIVAGVLLLAVGLAWLYLPGAARLVSWFGRLPGDIRFQSGGMSVFVPLTSMLLVSLALSLLLRLFR